MQHGGLFTERRRGLSRGCSLSPLLGAFFLRHVDRQMAEMGIFYVRYMDDVLILAPTRWWLRRAVARLNRMLATLMLEKHPAKTFIGRIERGFDFLGYRFDRAGLTVVAQTRAAFLEHAARLYEQEQRGAPSMLGPYVRRWVAWARGGLGGCPVSLAPTSAP